jgi:hypothetical protein
MKSINAAIEGSTTKDVIAAVVNVLNRAQVLPYHIVHIEHCCDCEHHAMSTWHIPGSYEKKCDEIRRMIRSYLPPTIVFSNKIAAVSDGTVNRTKDNMARIGALEVTVRPYYSHMTQLLFSKLARKELPQATEIVDYLSALVSPDTMYYTRRRHLRVQLYSAYNKKPVEKGKVSLYRVAVSTYTDQELEGECTLDDTRRHDMSLQQPRPPGAPQEEQEELLAAASSFPRSVVQSGKARPMSAGSACRPASAGGNSSSRQGSPLKPDTARATDSPAAAVAPAAAHQKGLPPKASAAASASAGAAKKTSFTTELLDSAATQDALFRHSEAFFRVRSWSQVDVDQWFRSLGVSEEAIAEAHYSGVEDGASLIALANKISFRKWGIRGRLVLMKLEASLSALKQPVEGYDPTIIGAFPSDGQQKVGFSKSVPRHKTREHRKGERFQRTSRFFELVSIRDLDKTGSVSFDVDVSGPFIVHVASPTVHLHSSPVFSFGTDMEYVYAAALKPVIVPVAFRVVLEDDEVHAKMLQGVPFATHGILISVVNIGSGRRHVALANFEDIVVENLVPPVGSPTISADTTAAPPTDVVVKRSPGKLKRYNSVVDLISEKNSGGKDAVATAMNMKMSGAQGAAVTHSGKLRKSKVASKKLKQNVIVTIAWLPVGRYFSEVDGSTFAISDQIAETSYAQCFSSRDSAIEMQYSPRASSERFFFGGQYSELQSIKAHKRIINRSIRGFQMIYRRYKKTFLYDKMIAYMVMKRAAHNFCNWAREKVRMNKIIKVQAFMRMATIRRQYRVFWKCAVFIQVRIRILLARRARKRRAAALHTLVCAISSWAYRWRRQRFLAARKIQTAFRRYAAERLRALMLIAKRCRKRFLKFMAHIKAKVRMAQVVKMTRKAEQMERELMSDEDNHMRLHVKWCKEQERIRLKEKIARIERRRALAASRIQGLLRGVRYRRRLGDGTRAVIRLQVLIVVILYMLFSSSQYKCLFVCVQRILRLRIYESQMYSSRQKYIPGLSSLLKHPQLLGGVKLLLGIYNPDHVTPPSSSAEHRSREARRDRARDSPLSSSRKRLARQQTRAESWQSESELAESEPEEEEGGGDSEVSQREPGASTPLPLSARSQSVDQGAASPPAWRGSPLTSSSSRKALPPLCQQDRGKLGSGELRSLSPQNSSAEPEPPEPEPGPSEPAVKLDQPATKLQSLFRMKK